MATGSEVELIIEAGAAMAENGRAVRLVSFPSWELFAKQDKAYRDDVLPPEIKARIAVEAGSPMGWSRWVGDSGVMIGIETFGASAPYKEIYQQYGLTVENIVKMANDMMDVISTKENDE
jgi:transketolase